MPWLDFERGGCADFLEMNGYMEGACAMALEDTTVWKPLVLLIPLRLGLSDINEAYIETLKVKKISFIHFYCIIFQNACVGMQMSVCFVLSFLVSTAMLHDASVLRGHWWEAEQCPLLHWLCW